MNLVERWFSALTTKKLQRSAHNSVAELAADINNWVTTWNDDPKPFIWTKSASEILEKVARAKQALVSQHWSAFSSSVRAQLDSPGAMSSSVSESVSMSSPRSRWSGAL